MNKEDQQLITAMTKSIDTLKRGLEGQQKELNDMKLAYRENTVLKKIPVNSLTSQPKGMIHIDLEF